ncbi:MAG: ATP synthase F0 subunit B [Pelolinea sp.]|jgi:cell division septum initiation protein DivIVA|nr:ATP synthase F0 subunit B [Pelolinea sp.]
MDILHLIDQLEELFNDSKSFWLTNEVMIKEDRLLDLIDQMRLAVPDEIKQSQQIINQKERILAQAQEEATRTVNLAREKSVEMVERDGIVEAARVKADQIIKKAEEQSRMMKRDADEYSIETLKELRDELTKILNQVNNGINALEDESNPSDERKTQLAEGYKDISNTSSR